MFNRLASGMIATTTSSTSLLPPDVASRRSQSIGLVSKGWPGGADQRWDVAVERGSVSAGNAREIDDRSKLPLESRLKFLPLVVHVRQRVVDLPRVRLF